MGLNPFNKTRKKALLLSMHREAVSHCANSRPLRGFISNNSEPIFIFGNQKSGTTIIANLLSIALGKSLTADFSRHFGSYDSFYELLGRRINLEEFIRLRPYEFSKGIIKEPNLSLVIADILKLYPHCKFIFISRNPLDNITSILSRLQISADYTKQDIYESNKINAIWKNILLGRDLQMLDHNPNAKHIEKVGEVFNLVERWKYITQSYFQHADSIIHLRYEDFIKDKADSIAVVLNKLDIEYTGSYVEHIDDQYQPKKTVSDLCAYLNNDQIALINEYLEIEIERLKHA